MTKEYRITSSDLFGSNDDCVLPTDDPIHRLKGQALVGALTPEKVSAAYAVAKQKQAEELLNIRAQAAKMGITPGTPAWYALIEK